MSLLEGHRSVQALQVNDAYAAVEIGERHTHQRLGVGVEPLRDIFAEHCGAVSAA